MAVILDVVYNHATGAHPYAAMYWDGGQNKTASNNPWFNVDAPHGWSVYHDWNHSNRMVREHIKRNLTYLMTEYKIDGFRFDLTKGFTQTNLESYEQNRVDYLKEYNAHILSVDEKAVMICEHFVDDENYALGQDGIKVWRNMNHPYSKAMKRDMSQSDFTGVTNGFNSNGMMADWNHFGSLVGYMESHDEQRTNYEGQWSYDGSSIPFATRMERAKANAAFFLLVPGPKMIWQFGEIGYDISIDDNGRTGKKPCKTTEYMNVAERKALYDTYSKLIAFRKKNHILFDYDVNFRWYVDGGHQTGRYLFATKDGKTMAVFGNFGQGTQSIGVELPAGGSWYQYDDSSKVWNGSSHTVQMAEGQFYVLVSDKSMCL
jgi:1,4-alpha-glucan branching enzyme